MIVAGLPAGVTGSYSAGVFTITGTPSVASATSYTYTVTTTGTCIQHNLTGTITVNPDATIALSSGAGTDAQNLCVNNNISTITYTISGGGTGATITGLPAGVTGSYSGGMVTITGSPSVTGPFTYIVTTTGTCVQHSLTGTITVNPDATIALSSAAGTDAQTLCINNSISNISYIIGGGGTGASVAGLPAGVGHLVKGPLTLTVTPGPSSLTSSPYVCLS